MGETQERRLAAGDRVVVASHNPGKVREISDLVAPFALEAVAAGDLGLDEPEETGASFAENACIKALAAAQASGMPALADDSGLDVAALDGGAPGIYSARWAEGDATFLTAMRRVHEALEAQAARSPEARRANFTCALCLAWPDGEPRVFEGRVFGHIVWPPRGEKGFGYDPIFIPAGLDQTFAEMAPAAKHAMSHRARAFALFVTACLASELAD